MVGEVLSLIYTESVIVKDRIRSCNPTMLLIVGSEPYEKLLEFFREKCFSLSSERIYVQVVGKFIEWLSVRGSEFTELSKRTLLFTAFTHDLRFGTYLLENEVHQLCWKPKKDTNCKRLIKALVYFSDWLSLRYGSTMINPIHQNASYTDQIIFWRAWNKQKVTSLFAHIKDRDKSREKSKQARRNNLTTNRIKYFEETKAFPTEYIDQLLWKGFINPKFKNDSRIWKKYNLRDILITLLCLYGACRASEPLHLWTDDVYVDPDDSSLALVLIHHPSDGSINYQDPLTGTYKATNRADFLFRFCDGRRPLAYETGRRHSGWKGCLLTHRNLNAFKVFWIDKEAGRLFLDLWRLYILHVRPVTPHMPWAFMTKEMQPLGFEGFDDSFRSAVKRIGLKPIKSLGTTTHGLRHRYGQWLNELNVCEKIGQVAMHHLNPTSQLIYRQLELSEVAETVGNFSLIKNIPEF